MNYELSTICLEAESAKRLPKMFLVGGKEKYTPTFHRNAIDNLQNRQHHEKLF
jgi:hypothetical protein